MVWRCDVGHSPCVPDRYKGWKGLEQQGICTTYDMIVLDVSDHQDLEKEEGREKNDPAVEYMTH